MYQEPSNRFNLSASRPAALLQSQKCRGCFLRQPSARCAGGQLLEELTGLWAADRSPARVPRFAVGVMFAARVTSSRLGVDSTDQGPGCGEDRRG